MQLNLMPDQAIIDHNLSSITALEDKLHQSIGTPAEPVARQDLLDALDTFNNFLNLSADKVGNKNIKDEYHN